jgi:tetratricopeptide (TPR) repeat protein
MGFIFRTLLAAMLMLGPAASVFADEGQQVRMLKLMFAQPEDRWQQVLTENKSLLDPEFFQRVEQRIRWSLGQSQVGDAIRFAQVGDLALGVVGEKPRFVAELAYYANHAPADWGQKSMFPAKPAESRRAILKARAAARQSRAEMAERLDRESLVEYPKSWIGWLELGRLHESQGNLDLAAHDYRRATRLWPLQGRPWQLRGKCAEARFDRSSDWDSLDEARLCYGKAAGLGQPCQRSLDRLNSKAKVLARQTVDLEGSGACSMQVSEDSQLAVGDAYSDHPLDRGDPISEYSGREIFGEWYPLASLPGESLQAYLERSYEQSDTGDSEVIEPEYLVTGGLYRGSVVWLRSAASHTSLSLGGRTIGTVNSPRVRWPLKNPFARFRDRQTGLEFELFRSSMFEIGLEISEKKVAAVYLAEPGRLRVNLQRLPRYRGL